MFMDERYIVQIIDVVKRNQFIYKQTRTSLVFVCWYDIIVNDHIFYEAIS